MSTTTRAVALNCMDGRAQLPVITWITENHGVTHVDMITEPGVDGRLADESRPADDLFAKVRLSIDVNRANAIFVVGHYDCKGNPVDNSTHHQHILAAARRLAVAFPRTPVTGLWVDANWSVNALPRTP